MSAPETTPGPWAYRPDEFDDWGMVRGAPDEQGRRWIICQARSPFCDEAKFADHRRLGTDPWEADAHLIAAAPDLYAALVDARERIAQLRDPEANGPWNDRLQRMIDAALAKASPSARSSDGVVKIEGVRHGKQ